MALQELGGLSRGSERAVEKATGSGELSAAHSAALRDKDTGEKLLREKDAELEELRALLRSKPISDPAPAATPAEQALAYASWPPGWVE